MPLQVPISCETVMLGPSPRLFDSAPATGAESAMAHVNKRIAESRRMNRPVFVAANRTKEIFKPIEPPQPPRLPDPSTSISHSAVSLASFLCAPPGPEQDCQNDRPNDAPTDPRDVWVSRLPFEDFLMDGH